MIMCKCYFHSINCDWRRIFNALLSALFDFDDHALQLLILFSILVFSILALARFEILCARSSRSSLTEIECIQRQRWSVKHDRDARCVHSCLSRSLSRRNEACGWKIFWYPIDVGSGFATPSTTSLLRDAWSADKKKRTPRKHNGASENDPRFLRYCGCALGTTPSRFPSRTVTLGAACRRDKFHP